MRNRCVLVLLLCGFTLNAMAESSLTRLTSDEKADLEKRIAEFYSSAHDPAAMNHLIPKYRVRTGLRAHPNAALALKSFSGKSTLQIAAGKKLEPWFLEAEKRWKQKHHKRGEWAEVESPDQIENLTDGFTDVEYDLSKLPLKGEAAQDVWSDDYWKTQYGQTSYRYGEGKTFKNYKEAVGDYQQPAAFTSLLDQISPEKITEELLEWSPAEKYDLTVGDTAFTLTNQQKEVGESLEGPTGDVEDWMGICHGWAAAAIFAPRPVNPVSVVGASGVPVNWYPDDIRALLSLSWANADIDTNFAGMNCYEKDPETYPNGRIKDQGCFGTNPATLHLALTNMIGRAKQAYVIDASYDHEIWNQPMKAYELTYFNPLDASKRSDDWTKVAVDYDDTFKAKDRFQHPLTRGKRQKDGTWDDSGVKKVVGVIATLVYLGEIDPTTTDVSPDDEEIRVTYTYDLELYDDDGLTPEGGEWHDNLHPNFDWIPVKGSLAAVDGENLSLDLDATKAPSAALRKAAAEASGDGTPLCRVVKGLLDRSEAEGVQSYSCGE